jgi:ActR/RegA family two-component response regulator
VLTLETNRKMQTYVPPRPAPLPADFDEFYASLTPQERELHALAIEKLQSSYFVQWSHMYRTWKKKKDGGGAGAK